jgi:hypothetical protein
MQAGPAAFTVSGMPIFPAYNDVGGLTWLACEVDACNAHVGKLNQDLAFIFIKMHIFIFFL